MNIRDWRNRDFEILAEYGFNKLRYFFFYRKCAHTEINRFKNAVGKIENISEL